MTRQVLPLIDLRSQAERQGITNKQRNIRAIISILQAIGQTEQVRRERQQLDRVVRATMALKEGATTTEIATALSTATRQEPQFGTGAQGLLQRIGGVFQPSPGGGIGQNIQQSIVGAGLQRALTPKPQIPAGLEPSKVTAGPRGVTREFAPPKKTKIQELIDEGYTPELARMIRDIENGIIPRASSRKHYDNMSDVEKLDFLSKLKRRAQGQYFGLEKGYQKAVDQNTLDWVEKEMGKLSMFQEQAAEEPTTMADFEAEVLRLKTAGQMDEARAYYDKWVSKWQ